MSWNVPFCCSEKLIFADHVLVQCVVRCNCAIKPRPIDSVTEVQTSLVFFGFWLCSDFGSFCSPGTENSLQILGRHSKLMPLITPLGLVVKMQAALCLVSK